MLQSERSARRLRAEQRVQGKSRDQRVREMSVCKRLAARRGRRRRSVFLPSTAATEEPETENQNKK